MSLNDLEAIAAMVKGEFEKLLAGGRHQQPRLRIPTRRPVALRRCRHCFSEGLPHTPRPLLSSASVRRLGKPAKARQSTSFYFDLVAAQTYLERGQTPFTPNLPLFYALDRSLDVLLDEGLEETYTRHAYFGDMTRRGVKALGLGTPPRRSLRL